MATGTYIQSNSPTATYNTNSAANLQLQNAINATGQAGSIATDRKYGPQTQNAYNSLIGQGYTYANGAFTKPTTNNPVISGTGTANDNNAIDKDVKKLYDSSGLTKSSNSLNDLLQQRYDALSIQRDNDVAGITADYEQALREQGSRQKKEYAGESTNLITAGGGFLGFTGSHAGVLQNMQHTFDNEKTALLAKRDAAIQAAKNAVDDKQFALAKEQAQLAKDTEKELYSRQQDFAEQKLALARESRSQQEFDMGLTDKKIQAYAAMDDAEFNAINKDDIAQLDKAYFPGYTIAKRRIDKESSDTKRLDDIYSVLNKIPYGQTVNLGGKTYVGTKNSGGSSLKGLIPSSLASQLGVPSLAGQDESDVILSLSLDTPPLWYKQFYQQSNPSGYAQIMNNPAALKVDWQNFKSLPDIQAYANSATVTNRINKASGNGEDSDNPWN